MVSRRDFLIHSAFALARASLVERSFALPAQASPPADHTIHIAPIDLEISPGKIVRTTAFSDQVPGDLEVINFESGKFSTPQPAAKKYRDHCKVTKAAQIIRDWS